MICPDVQAPVYFIFSSEVPGLIYYSHIPTAISALVLGFFVLYRSKTLESKLFFLIALIFSLWNFFNLILWTNINSDVVAFFWCLVSVLEVCLFFVTFYFSYVFMRKRDMPLGLKFLLTTAILPFLLLNTRTVDYFRLVSCDVSQALHITYGAYVFEIVIFVAIFLMAYFQHRKEESAKLKKQIVLFAIGMEFFLGCFITSGLVANIFYERGLSYAFQVEQYGLFGMPVFLIFIAYLIARFGVFKIKVVGAQILVVMLVLSVGSQLFFAQNKLGFILTSITLVLLLVFGYILVRLVKKDVVHMKALEVANKEISERKEQLQMMADSLAGANDQLRKLDNAKTEFISIASHQLRTPVTAIKGFVSLILEGSYGEISKDAQGALEKVYISSERLVALIEDLLNVSRIESGRMTFVFEKADADKLLRELYENFILIAKTKKLYLELNLPETSLPEIVMDYAKIRELVSNFIDNALKYTEKGGVTVKTEIRDEGMVIDENGAVIVGRKSSFGKMLRITVSDTGIGIPKEEIPYLFKKFSRGKDVSRLHVGGTGLGLYVGKAIAQAHHGQVWVESDGAGLGSRFIIEIPVEHVE